MTPNTRKLVENGTAAKISLSLELMQRIATTIGP